MLEELIKECLLPKPKYARSVRQFMATSGTGVGFNQCIDEMIKKIPRMKRGTLRVLEKMIIPVSERNWDQANLDEGYNNGIRAVIKLLNNKRK